MGFSMRATALVLCVFFLPTISAAAPVAKFSATASAYWTITSAALVDGATVIPGDAYSQLMFYNYEDYDSAFLEVGDTRVSLTASNAAANGIFENFRWGLSSQTIGSASAEFPYGLAVQQT